MNVAPPGIAQFGLVIAGRPVITDFSGLEERKAFALKIAQDLFNYLSSFSSSNSQSYMTIPTNLLDKWMERFEAKYRRDPNFMMKN
ncbi:hypothetical protein AM588_10001394 [Phytophthora nicotianae]|uniref:Hikeshi-like C-terminal domain-containing protein n=1 Tax=Phytophthora nicotianae TaxID=4792 RepID=A0A0W8CSJ2_PHYNI|nr:hypothetical protein AM588_10001394 [Phytophthora nicotianae]